MRTLVVLLLLGAFESDPGARIDRLLAEAERLGSREVLRNDLALPLCREAIALAGKSGDDARAARAWSAFGLALWELNRFDAATVALGRARALAHDTGQRTLETEVLRRIGMTHFQQASFQQADRTLQEALALARDLGDRPGQVAILNTLSVNARHQGRLADAEAHVRQGLLLLDALLAEGASVSGASRFQIPFNLGKALADAGDYGSAITYFERAFASAEATGYIGGQWHALHDTAEWYLAQGEPARAARYFERALAMSREYKEQQESEGYSLRGLGALAEARGDFGQAATRYAEAATLFRRIGLPGRTPAVLAALSRVQSLTGADHEAAASANQALQIATAHAQPIGQALARLELARLHSRAREAGKAADEYGRVLSLARAEGLRPLESAALAGLADLEKQRGELLEAIRLYRAAADTIEAIRARILSPDLRAAYAHATSEAYSGLLSLLMELHKKEPLAGHDREALLALERQRSQNLLQALSDASAGRRRTVPAERRQRRRELEAQVAQLQIQLSSDGVGVARRRDLLAGLDDAERALAAIEGASGARESAQAASAEPSAWMDAQTLETLQQRLEPGEAVVEYGAAWAFIVTPRILRVVELSPVTRLDERIEFFTRLLAGSHPEDALPAGHALARAILEPVLAVAPPDTKRLLFVSGGALAGLPFAALPVPQRARSGTAVPLLQRYEISHVPSLGALAQLRSRARATTPRQILAIAASGSVTPSAASVDGSALRPLPNSRREAQSVARRVSGRAELLLEPSASEAAFKARRLGEFGVLHFAAHAVLDPVVPSRSAILLGAESGEDGLLQSREIYGLDLAADLVVLSACRTAAGRISSAEGMESLARAFLYAGGRSVVGTLWDVEDQASAETVERFYDALAEGRPAADALRQAQLSMLGGRPYVKARNWAAFLLTGDPSVRVSVGRTPLQDRLARHWLRIASIGGGLAIVLGAFFRTRRRAAA